MTIKKGHFSLAQSSSRSFCGRSKERVWSPTLGGTLPLHISTGFWFSKEAGKMLGKHDSC